MALYRNIAGIPGDGGQVGLTNFTNFTPGSGSTLIRDPAAVEAAASGYYAEMRSRYEYALKTDTGQLATEGIFVAPDNGSLFQGTYDYAKAWLPLQDIQKIENERGTAGALLLHMNEPALAKDTAGYEGGSSGTFSGQPPVVDPIIAVQVLPPVVTDSTGVVYFDPATAPADTYPIPTDPTTPATPPTTVTPTTSTPLPADWQTLLKNNWLPIAVIGGLLVVSIGGDKLIRRRSRLVFIGGIGGLFFLMAKK